MTYYSAFATDQYMRSVLDELTDDETDNALTALTTLTSLIPGLFPFDSTFVLLDHQKDSDKPSGVRFVVFGPRGVVRMIRVPRSDLTSIAETIDTVIIMSSILVSTEA